MCYCSTAGSTGKLQRRVDTPGRESVCIGFLGALAFQCTLDSLLTGGDNYGILAT